MRITFLSLSKPKDHEKNSAATAIYFLLRVFPKV